MHGEYDTIASPVHVNIEMTRSKFFTRLERVENEAAARTIIAETRSAHPRARHHCSAFVLGPDSRVQRSNDDGEPNGTAGAPMLDALISAALSDVVAVVTRYFGGILLGAGGLTRAYRAAVAEAVAASKRVRRAPRRTVTLRSAYDIAPHIQAQARRHGFGVGDADYGAEVSQNYLVPEESIDVFRTLAAAVSSGAATVELGPLGYVDLPGDCESTAPLPITHSG